ncbi:MAG: hypothetical protein ACTIDE_08960 [Carnobacterium maltaromaticum]|uniref:hypothetical protein n=1 Tax=Carnobacterium maltaromaticum TaxID=2751 RepID=UPI00191BC48C|nr:hypothetical protein [Carnobacterium maltaromaticum]CAD5899516.1 conserved hypothetical protein [Carnobacterium maltaromaticum]
MKRTYFKNEPNKKELMLKQIRELVEKTPSLKMVEDVINRADLEKNIELLENDVLLQNKKKAKKKLEEELKKAKEQMAKYESVTLIRLAQSDDRIVNTRALGLFYGVIDEKTVEISIGGATWGPKVFAAAVSLLLPWTSIPMILFAGVWGVKAGRGVVSQKKLDLAIHKLVKNLFTKEDIQGI